MRADAEGQTALRLRQGAQRAEKLDRAVPGRFVTGMERQEAQREAKACGVLASFDGGWDDAERAGVFSPGRGGCGIYGGLAGNQLGGEIRPRWAQ
ncbi:MAG: hypothetical protein ACLTXW_16330 [Christensenellales bacterium]